MTDHTKLTRRSALSMIAGATGAALTAAAPGAAFAQGAKVKGRLKQSVCKWCFPKMSVEELCKNAAAMGIQSVELLGKNDWDTCKKYGLTCAMALDPEFTSIGDGWNRVENHDRFVQAGEKAIPQVKEAGLVNLICFSGNRRGLSDADGLENCAKGLKRIMPLAEQLGVNVVMELLNSKVDHKDYQCDHTAWGVELCKRVGSDRFKLLYDIYHMQIMEGDVIRTVQDNIKYIAHFHTGGVPGRNEIDTTQELNYERVSRAIVDTGFTGHFAHEFIPKRDPMTSLQEAVKLCDV
jgi:hydroxypyruvate isomerase